jgi:hypothetical protein
MNISRLSSTDHVPAAIFRVSDAADQIADDVVLRLKSV